MTQADKIKDQSYMVLCNLAFIFYKSNEKNRSIIVYNINNIKQKATYSIMDDGRCLLKETSMSEANTYKSMAILERNKQFILRGYAQWENTLKNA